MLIGFFVGLVTGLVENNVSQPSADNSKYYGFPLIWRIIDTTGVRSVYFPGFFVDWAFGIVLTLFMLLIAKKTEETIMRRNPPSKKKSVHRLVDFQAIWAGIPINVTDLA
jgi:hypothetical protein